jgi:hypothetical protein
MNFKFLSLFVVLLMTLAFSYSANAEKITNDIIFGRAGYIPKYYNSFDDDVTVNGVMYQGTVDSFKGQGFAINGEYNFNINALWWIGLGIEYQYVMMEQDVGEADIAQFIIPQINGKYVIDVDFYKGAAFYIGAGLAGKYLVDYEDRTEGDVKWEPDKKIDLWVNVIFGYLMPLSESIYLDAEARVGFNVTNTQWESAKSSNGDFKYVYSPKYSYDVAIYIGIGYKIGLRLLGDM